MTMPHLMNCPHIEDGWCLTCVSELENEKRELQQWIEREELKNEMLRAECDALASELQIKIKQIFD